MKHEMETLREIWPERGEGEHIEVGPDRDGLGLVEIRQKEPNGQISARISMTTEAAILVSKALSMCADELGQK